MKHTILSAFVVTVILYTAFTLATLATEDVTGPAITASTWSISPTTVNTTSGAQTVTFSATITDALTGFGRGIIYLYPPNRASQYQFIHFNADNRTSGDAFSGVYSVTTTLPRYSNVGTWTIGHVELIDAIGNNTVYRAGDAIFGTYTTLVTQ